MFVVDILVLILLLQNNNVLTVPGEKEGGFLFMKRGSKNNEKLEDFTALAIAYLGVIAMTIILLAYQDLLEWNYCGRVFICKW